MKAMSSPELDRLIIEHLHDLDAAATRILAEEVRRRKIDGVVCYVDYTAVGLMVELMAPEPKDTVCDPASGTCGFLVAASEYIQSFEFRLRGREKSLLSKLDLALKKIDAGDPLRYDFAVCHLGISGKCPARRVAEICVECDLNEICQLPARDRRTARP